MQSLVAAARRVTSAKILRQGPMNGREWQDEAWNMYDLVGENHYLATTLAGRMSQARLYVGLMPEDDTQEPEQVTTGPAAQAFDALSSLSGRQQMIARLGTGLFVAGEGWIVGIPRHLFGRDNDAAPASVRTATSPAARIAPELPPPPEPALEDLEWRVLSVSEVSATKGDQVALRCGEGKDGILEVDPDEVYLIRVWRPHPRLWHEADSPVRASLPVLRELTGLTMHVSAQVDSRLAGAGMLLVPASASAAVRAAAGAQPGDDSDPLTDALMESMITPIRDRASASALVPLVVTVPDDAVDKFKHMDFSSRLDPEARGLREEAIRRLALGLDAPPEILLGTAAQNHWGAWLVREDVVSTHLEPPLALICDALTTQYLQPVLAGQGMPAAEARKYVVWYDVSQLVTRPNRFSDAKALHEAGVISDKALRDAGGFGDDEAPMKLPPSAERALAMISNRGGAALAVVPGIVDLAKQLAHLSQMTEDELSAGPIPVTSKTGAPAAVAGEASAESAGGPDQNPAPPEAGPPASMPSQPPPAQGAP
jgi:hypothetical protein